MKIDQARSLLAATRRLAQMDPQDEAVARTVQGLQEQIAQLTTEVEKPTGEKNSFGDNSRKQDVKFLKDQISKLKSAAEAPAKNYLRIEEILKGLHRAVEASERPQYAALRPRISTIVEKLAGVFSEVDTVQDLDKPLSAIEKAVHGLYGDQSSNATYYFDRRGKGHHTKGEGETAKSE
jgi:hypothetical protein